MEARANKQTVREYLIYERGFLPAEADRLIDLYPKHIAYGGELNSCAYYVGDEITNLEYPNDIPNEVLDPLFLEENGNTYPAKVSLIVTESSWHWKVFSQSGRELASYKVTGPPFVAIAKPLVIQLARYQENDSFEGLAELIHEVDPQQIVSELSELSLVFGE